MRAVVLLLSALQLQAAWISLRTPQVQLLTDSSEKSAQETLDRLATIQRVFEQAGEPISPLSLRVFLFASEKEFRPYASSPTAEAFFQSGPERNYIVLHTGSGLTRAVAHEYVHLILNHTSAPLPHWFEEGMAEFYSNLTIIKGRLIVGEPIRERLQTLASQQWINAEQLMAANSRSAVHDERALAGVFYAQSWALVHMINLSPKWRNGMPEFAQGLSAGKETREAFQEAFGRTVDQALKDLGPYLSQMKAATVDAPPVESRDAAVVATVAPLEATLLQADLALHVTHPELAQTLFAKASAEQPDSPRAETGLAILAMSRNSYDEARRHFQRAMELGSKEAETYFEAAMLEREATRARPRELLHKVIELDPNFAEAHFLLGLWDTDDGRYEEAIQELNRAVKILPRQSYFWHALAYAQLKSGHAADAKVSARRAVRTSSTQEEEHMAETLLDSIP